MADSELQQRPAESPFERSVPVRLHRATTPTAGSGIPTAYGVDHLGYSIPDLDQAVKFFTDACGGALAFRTDLVFGATLMRRQLDTPADCVSRMAMIWLGPVTNVELFEHHVPHQEVTHRPTATSVAITSRSTRHHRGRTRGAPRTLPDTGRRPSNLAIWIGGNGSSALRRAARFGTAWHPMHPHRDTIAGSLAQMAQLASEHGRPTPSFCPRIALHPTAQPLPDRIRALGHGTALESLPDCYERDRARYAAQLALALAGSGDADGALVVAMRAAELATTTGSALATRELRRVRAAMRERGADAPTRALAEHVRALWPTSLADWWQGRSEGGCCGSLNRGSPSCRTRHLPW